MTALLEQLRKDGWYLSERGIEECRKALNSSSDISAKEVEKIALELDLRAICDPGGVLPVPSQHSLSEVVGPTVLQVQKVKDVSRPLAVQRDSSQGGSGASRLLRLFLTDGKVYISAVEMQFIKELDITAISPGTKIMINPKSKVKIFKGFLQLCPGTVKLLGGKVEHLVKKGKVQSAPKPAAERGVEDGPPSFVPFSQYQPPARHKVPSSRVSNSRGAEQGTRYTGQKAAGSQSLNTPSKTGHKQDQRKQHSSQTSRRGGGVERHAAKEGSTGQLHKSEHVPKKKSSDAVVVIEHKPRQDYKKNIVASTNQYRSGRVTDLSSKSEPALVGRPKQEGATRHQTAGHRPHGQADQRSSHTSDRPQTGTSATSHVLSAADTRKRIGVPFSAKRVVKDDQLL